MVNDIEVGREIRDKVFNANNYAQLSQIRKSIWALAVLNDNIEGDKIKAQEIINLSIQVNTQIEEILNKHYAEDEQNE